MIDGAFSAPVERYSDPQNGIGRLTSFSDGTATTTYGWAETLDRTSVQAPGGSPVPTTYDDANRPLAQNGVAGAFTSDADGQLTARPNADGTAYQRMEWDHLGRLARVKGPSGNSAIATYTYDPLDRLRLVDYGGNTRVRFRYVGLTTSAVQTLNDQTGAVLRNIGTGWDGELLEDWTGSGANLRIFGLNAHHDLTWTAGASGTVRYDPWGTATSVTGSVPDFRFQSSYADETTKLSWVVSRWYAPAQGHFISEDADPGEKLRPRTIHQFAYGGGDPVYAFDPDGLHYMRVDAPTTWTNIARRYYGSETVAAQLAAQNFAVAGPSSYVSTGKTYKLPDSLGGQRHTVYGRDDPVGLHSGYVFGPPFQGDPWADGWRAWRPKVMSPTLCQTACLTSGTPTYVSAPSGAGSWRWTKGWRSADFSFGMTRWFSGQVAKLLKPIYGVASNPLGVTFYTTVAKYEHGQMVTMWFNYDLTSYHMACYSVAALCPVRLTTNFVLRAGGPINSYGATETKVSTVPYSHDSRTYDFSRSFSNAPRDTFHANFWVPRAWGNSTRFSGSGGFMLAGGTGTTFDATIQYSDPESYMSVNRR